MSRRNDISKCFFVLQLFLAITVGNWLSSLCLSVSSTHRLLSSLPPLPVTGTQISLKLTHTRQVAHQCTWCFLQSISSFPFCVSPLCCIQWKKSVYVLQNFLWRSLWLWMFNADTHCCRLVIPVMIKEEVALDSQVGQSTNPRGNNTHWPKRGRKAREEGNALRLIRHKWTDFFVHQIHSNPDEEPRDSSACTAWTGKAARLTSFHFQ